MLSLNSIENKFIFPYLRIASLTAIGLLTISILSSLFQVLEPTQTTLSYIIEQESEVKKPSYKVPQSLTDVISDEGIAIIKGWANGLPSEFQQSFLNGIARLLKDSAKRGEARFSLAHLDKYRDLEIERIRKITAMRAGKDINTHPLVKFGVIVLLIILLVILNYCNGRKNNK